MARCGSCNAPMLWAKTIQGRPIPIDASDQGGYLAPEVVPDGNLTLERGSFPDTAVVRYVQPGEGRYRTHFATCPDGPSHRRGR